MQKLTGHAKMTVHVSTTPMNKKTKHTLANMAEQVLKFIKDHGVQENAMLSFKHNKDTSLTRLAEHIVTVLNKNSYVESCIGPHMPPDNAFTTFMKKTTGSMHDVCLAWREMSESEKTEWHTQADTNAKKVDDFRKNADEYSIDIMSTGPGFKLIITPLWKCGVIHST